MERELILCIPGLWTNRSDFIRHVVTTEPPGMFAFAHRGILRADTDPLASSAWVPADFSARIFFGTGLISARRSYDLVLDIFQPTYNRAGRKTNGSANKLKRDQDVRSGWWTKEEGPTGKKHCDKTSQMKKVGHDALGSELCAGNRRELSSSPQSRSRVGVSGQTGR